MSGPKRTASGSMKLLAEAVQELSTRPAMNGGFQSLMKQQVEQLTELRKSNRRQRRLERRVGKLEDSAGKVEGMWRWVKRLMWFVVAALVTEFIARLVDHLHLVVH